MSGAVSDIALQMFHQLLGSDALRAACVPDKTDLTFRDRLDQTDGKHFPARNRFGGKRFRVEADAEIVRDHGQNLIGRGEIGRASCRERVSSPV